MTARGYYTLLFGAIMMITALSVGSAGAFLLGAGAIIAVLLAAVSVLFAQLGRLGDKAAINAAAAHLGDGVYRLYRHLYRASGANEDYFALDAEVCAMGFADADMKLEERNYVQALRQQKRLASWFPSM